MKKCNAVRKQLTTTWKTKAFLEHLEHMLEDQVDVDVNTAQVGRGDVYHDRSPHKFFVEVLIADYGTDHDSLKEVCHKITRWLNQDSKYPEIVIRFRLHSEWVCIDSDQEEQDHFNMVDAEKLESLKRSMTDCLTEKTS